jgi:hypothetical protein
MTDIKTMYPLKGIFTDLLEDAEKVAFMIPAYQRGYKWGSSGGNSQVEVLLRDLFVAFNTKRKRFYLQFITVKENDNVLEVIDGQQRLTTITIIFSALNLFEGHENFIKDKLHYQVRQNFVKKYIYENVHSLLDPKDWDDFLVCNTDDSMDINNQDVYFLFNSFRKVYEFIKEMTSADMIGFAKYLSENVYLIINYLDKDLNSEKIFININKGVKLKDEDLVKGLLITKIPLDQDEKHYRLTENEINEIRSNIGRQWDEISNWSSREEVRTFFRVRNYGNSIGWIIRLAFPDSDKVDDLYPLFSFIEGVYKNQGYSAEDIFNKIRETMLTLNDWFHDAEIYNLLGYLLHSKESADIFLIWHELSLLKTKTEVLGTLKNKCRSKLPLDKTTGGIEELNYEDHRPKLFNLFLILDVSKVLPVDKASISRYDFSQISSDNWSIEHIFPQNIKDFKSIKSLTKDDLVIVKELVGGTSRDLNLVEEEKRMAVLALLTKVDQSLEECEITPEEQPTLEYLLKLKGGSLHKLGNLALLKQGMNSSLSNHFFDEKRKILVKKVSNGEFVPFHTYDVFSKLIIGSETSLHVWSETDIKRHQEYIVAQIEKINHYLS